VTVKKIVVAHGGEVGVESTSGPLVSTHNNPLPFVNA
jgi:hypothetical protein